MLYRNVIKRILDFVLALIASVFVAVLCLVIAPFIYLEDKGPIFYTAQRRGRGGVPFNMLKLRSMYVNSPDLRNPDGSTYNGKDDKRVTKIGKLLRETSLDEIPQVFNILKGDMSIIGPRPSLAARPYDQLSDESKKRLLVKPGLTGYTQAYYRNSIPQEKKIEFDCYYVDNCSFILDCKIFFKTIEAVFRKRNVYVSAQPKETEEKKTEEASRELSANDIK